MAKRKASECMYYDPQQRNCKVKNDCECTGCSFRKDKDTAVSSAKKAVTIYMINHRCSRSDAEIATLYWKQMDAIEAAYGH